MNLYNLGVYKRHRFETDLEICFVEQFLDAIIKRDPAEFLCNFGIQQMIGSFSFSVILKPKRLVYSVFSSTTFISFVVSVIFHVQQHLFHSISLHHNTVDIK